MGIIAEDALLQVQLRFMQAESKLNSAKIEIESRLNQLRSFLGFKDNVEIELMINATVPGLKVSYEEVLNYALTRNPEIISYKRQILEAQRSVAQAKSQTGVTLNLDASFGMNNTGYSFNDAYSPPFGNREGVNLRINVPIIDWKQARNRYLNAQSNLEVIETQIQQDETDFKQNIYLQVMRFNMQENQLRISATADTVARKGYDVSYQRYMLGRGSITELNIADTDKDQARMNYMSELRAYWNYYYTIRRLTLFDFLNSKPIEEDFDRITGD
jgi:outer membrane protein TolC